MCTAGKRSVENDNSELICAECESGQFNKNDALSKCEQCKENQWTCPDSFNGTGVSPVCKGSTKCTSCPAGRSGTDGITCIECSPGYYNNDIAGGICKFCPVGQYQSGLGRSSCIRCEPGRFNDRASAAVSSCKECNPGTYANHWLGYVFGVSGWSISTGF